MSQVMTVTGPLDSDLLDVTLVHEHIYVDLRKDVWLSDRMLNDTGLAFTELMQFKNAGGVTLVDQTSGGLKGNEHRILSTKHPLAIRDIARRTGLNIILGSGWYRAPYYEPYLWKVKTDQIAEEIVSEVVNGIEGTNVKAGIIGEIGAHGNYLLPVEERVLRAAARAQKRTGLSLSTHQSEGTVAFDQLDILEEEGVDLRRVIASHAFSYPHHEYHAEIARRGAFVSFEGFGFRHPYNVDKDLVLLRKMIDNGLIGHMLLSHDVCMKPMYSAYGGSGYGYILTTGRDVMREVGISDEQIDQIMVDNPRRALTGDD